VARMVDQAAEAASHYVAVNAELAKRTAAAYRRDPGAGGPSLQQAWMTWAASAGDIVTMWFTALQVVDTFAGWVQPEPEDGD